MKKSIVVASLLLGGVVTGLSAGGDIGGSIPFENEIVDVIVEPIPVPTPVVAEIVVETPVAKGAPKEEVVKEETHHSDYYLTLKGLSIAGEEIGHHETDKGLGLGVDLGYRLGGGFATELGLSYAKNKLNNVASDKASYKTAALSLVYDLGLTDNLALFAKGGYMYEKEKVSALNIDASDKGLVYGGGLTYKLTDSMNLVGEYEASKIDSLRGDAIGLGLMFNF